MFKLAAALSATVLIAAPAAAATPRDILVDAAFRAPDKSSALARVGQAQAAADAILAATPGDREARLVHAMSVAYRAKLTKGRADAVTAGKLFAALVAENPRDPEAQAALGSWHLDAVAQVGAMLAGMALGAKKAPGYAAMDRAVALGGGRAMFAGLSALQRLVLDPGDPSARALAEAAARGTVPTPIDQIIQRAATAVLVPLRAGDTAAAANMARQLLPFGRIKV